MISYGGFVVSACVRTKIQQNDLLCRVRS